MPRIRRGLEASRKRHPRLVEDLARELKESHESGQPIIEELEFPRTNNLRVTVIWDRWDPIPDEDRGNVILQAYEQVEGKEFTDRIALTLGLTVPDAVETGILLYRVVPLLRAGDPVTLEQCLEAMREEGASVLADPSRPELRFLTEEDAAACCKRLAARLPGSEPVWTVVKDTPPGE
jgi:hypothetical protein